MNYKEAINASSIWAARGYDEAGLAVVAMTYYDDKLMWLPGFGGNWAKKWEEFPEDGEKQIEGLDFRPFGRKPDDQLAAELLAVLKNEEDVALDEEMRQAMEEIAEEYEYADEVGEDYFEPMGETYD